MPLNIVHSDDESDFASSDYEFVGPPSRPPSWETYHDPYDSESDLVPLPHARPQPRRASASSEERKLRKLQREEEELREQLRLVRQADEKEAVFRGGPTAVPPRAHQDSRGGFKELPAHAPPGHPLGYHDGGVPESRPAHHSAGRRSPHGPVYAAGPEPVYELDSDGRGCSVSRPARRCNSNSPPPARDTYSVPRGGVGGPPSRHAQYGNSNDERLALAPAPHSRLPPPQGPAPGGPPYPGRPRMPSHQPPPGHSAPPTRSGSYYHEANGEGVPAYSHHGGGGHRGSRPRLPPPDEAPDRGYRNMHPPPPPRPYEANSDGLRRVSPAVYGHPDPLPSRRSPPPPRRVSGGPSGEVPLYRAPAPLPTPLKLRDPTGHVFSFPYAKCKKWSDIHDLIKGACGYQEHIGPAVMAGAYELIDEKTNTQVLMDEWEYLVKPGWELTLLAPRPAASPPAAAPPPAYVAGRKAYYR